MTDAPIEGIAPTPRTDALDKECQKRYAADEPGIEVSDLYDEMGDLARTLERELAEAKANEATAWLSQHEQLERAERAEAELRRSYVPRPDIAALVNRFLAWKLPTTVSPDGRNGDPERTGTNLLSAIEARQMFEHVLDAAPAAPVSATFAQDAKDAARYRWLKESWSTSHGSHSVTWHFPIGCAEVYDFEPLVDKRMAKDAEDAKTDRPAKSDG